MNDICNTYTKSGLLITDCCIFIKCIVMAVRLNDLLAHISGCVNIRKVICCRIQGILACPKSRRTNL